MHSRDDRKFIINNDDTAAPKAHQTTLDLLQAYPEKTRIVRKAGAPICAFGYGISYRGAQKILLALGIIGGSNLAFDNGMAFLCRDGFLDMKCYSVEPMLFHHHRPPGRVDKDSDINANDPSNISRRGYG